MGLPGWPYPEPPFHGGEIAVQARAGVEEAIAAVGRRVIRAMMPAQHREFFAQLPFVVLGAVDEEGQPWASILTGAQVGFVAAPDERTLDVAAVPDPDDPMAPLLRRGAALALLGIELLTRRRNRANGRIVRVRDDGFLLGVEQSFGNCAKYISVRELVARQSGPSPSAPERLANLDAAARSFIRGADTFFIATHAPGTPHDGGADIAHRGGPPGFVRVSDDGSVLAWPDFQGNRYFNTLGNLVLNSRAGLLFPDFRSGDLLHVVGEARIEWRPEASQGAAGPDRSLCLQVREVVRRPAAWPLRWRRIEAA